MTSITIIIEEQPRDSGKSEIGIEIKAGDYAATAIEQGISELLMKGIKVAVRTSMEDMARETGGGSMMERNHDQN